MIGSPGNPACKQIVDASTVDIYDLETPAVMVEALAGDGQMPQPKQRKARNRVVADIGRTLAHVGSVQ